MTARRYLDRTQAGRELGQALTGYARRGDVTVLALPRGGVPVAYEVALALQAPLDLFVVRKLGVPGHEEFAMGAIAGDGTRVLDQALVRSLGISNAAIERVMQAEQRELERREHAYRGDRARPGLRGRTVIVVDDGLATGSTMRAAVRALRHQAPAGIVVAVPVGAPDTCRMLRGEADDVVCPLSPSPLESVGQWYQDFSQTSDAEVSRLLALAQGPGTPTRG